MVSSSLEFNSIITDFHTDRNGLDFKKEIRDEVSVIDQSRHPKGENKNENENDIDKTSSLIFNSSQVLNPKSFKSFSATSSNQNCFKPNYNSLIFINDTLQKNKIGKPLRITFIIRAFIRYIQNSQKINIYPTHIPTFELNLLLFRKYLHKFLTLINLIPYDLPLEVRNVLKNNRKYSAIITITFKGPLLLCNFQKGTSSHLCLRLRDSETKYRYHAEIELIFFNRNVHDDQTFQRFEKLINKYFVQNPLLLNFARLQLSGEWILNNANVETTIRNL